MIYAYNIYTKDICITLKLVKMLEKLLMYDLSL